METKIELRCDRTYGVTRSEEKYENVDFLLENDFYTMIDLDEYEGIIYGLVSESLYEKIKKEFGIGKITENALGYPVYEEWEDQIDYDEFYEDPRAAYAPLSIK
jgi:hypothetical protein